MPVKILKYFKKELSEPRTKLINLSFSTGQFPNSLKVAKVILVFKKGGQEDSNNYRPISLLSKSKLIAELIY